MTRRAVDMAIVKRAIEGDEVAKTRIFESMQGYTKVLSLRLLRVYPNYREDAEQEAMLHLFNKLHLFEGRSAFSTWAYRVVCNSMLYTLRRLKKDTPNDLNYCDEIKDSGEEEPGAILTDKRRPHLQTEARIDIERAMQKLSPAFRVALEQRYLLELSYEEAALLSGKSIGSKKSYISRVLTIINKIMTKNITLIKDKNYRLPEVP